LSPCTPVAAVALPQLRHGGAGDHTIQLPASAAERKTNPGPPDGCGEALHQRRAAARPNPAPLWPPVRARSFFVGGLLVPATTLAIRARTRTAWFDCTYRAVQANYRHSAYRFRFATIAYRWHPLFGRKLQVSPFRRGKELTCIYTNERPGLCRELPNWMFDESYCAGMTLGPPEINIEGLNELASILASFEANRKRGAQSHPSRTKEVDRAEKPAPQSCAARSRAGSSDSDNTRGGKHKGAGRGPGRSSAGSAGCRNEAGRRR